MRSQILYPAVPTPPGSPVLTEALLGALGARTEYYVLTYLTPYGESLAGPEANISVDANNVVVVAPPDYPHPYAIYGYNVYAASASGAECLQNGSTPILPGSSWTEPASGLVTGTATPPTSWIATTLSFGIYSYATKVPAYSRAAAAHKNVASSGILETIYEHTDTFTDINIDFASIGADIAGWNTFIQYAERGGVFSFYPDDTVGGGGSGFTNYTLWDDNWTAAYKAPQLYSFKMKWRESGGENTGGSGGTVGGDNFADNIIPVDSGDHQHFTLPNTPAPAASLILVLRGADYPTQPLLQGGGLDYTLSGAAITMTSAITGTFELRAFYRY
jgi:hypothetical protein